MPAQTRHHLLTHTLPALALAALLPACGQRPSTPLATLSRSSIATPSMGTPQAMIPTRTPQPATAPVFNPANACAGLPLDAGSRPSDPYRSYGTYDVVLLMPFAITVRSAELIAIGTVRDILPARWATPDGTRPANPHTFGAVTIITPIRIAIDRIAKGDYALPNFYTVVPAGRIGEECVGYGGSPLGWIAVPQIGARLLFCAYEAFGGAIRPVPDDDRYRYYGVDPSYSVYNDDTITIYGYSPADNAPRTLTVDEVLREIATITSQPTGTPTR